MEEGFPSPSAGAIASDATKRRGPIDSRQNGPDAAGDLRR
jgi:hypothetical protein